MMTVGTTRSGVIAVCSYRGLCSPEHACLKHMLHNYLLSGGSSLAIPMLSHDHQEHFKVVSSGLGWEQPASPRILPEKIQVLKPHPLIIRRSSLTSSSAKAVC